MLPCRLVHVCIHLSAGPPYGTIWRWGACAASTTDTAQMLQHTRTQRCSVLRPSAPSAPRASCISTSFTVKRTRMLSPLEASEPYGPPPPPPPPSVRSGSQASFTADLKTWRLSRLWMGRKLLRRYSTDLTWSCCSVVKME